jgi:hypothetical protein
MKAICGTLATLFKRSSASVLLVVLMEACGSDVARDGAVGGVDAGVTDLSLAQDLALPAVDTQQDVALPDVADAPAPQPDLDAGGSIDTWTRGSLDGAGNEAAAATIDGGGGATTLSRIVGAWDFEPAEDLDGWTGVPDCQKALSGRCALTNDSSGQISYSIPGYVAMTPYRISFWATGNGAVFGQIFDSSLWNRFSFVFRVLGTSCTFSLYAASTAPVYIDKVTLEAVTWREQVAYSDGVMDELGGEVPDQTDETRFRYLPQTMDRLRQGVPLRMLFLGDSLCNDTFTGQWEALIRRGFPNAQITPLISVRGSTGVIWYAQDNRLADYVYQQKPDMIYIGGISNGVDESAWHSVIDQIRANLPAAEILVGSSASAVCNDPDSSVVVSRVARDTKVAFLDSARYFRKVLDDLGIACYSGGQYCGTGDNWPILGRDATVHQNNRGSEVLARIYATFFTGKPR